MSDPFAEALTIPREYHGQRIDRILAQMIPEFSRAQLTHALKNGQILVNGGQSKPKDTMYGGESITFMQDISFANKEVKEALPEDIPLDIIYEDEDCILINKPAGLIVHPGAGNPTHTLVNALLYHDPSLEALPRAGIIHRLDKDTTGILIVAKTPTAHTALIRDMQARTIQRRYLALVHGHLIAGATIETGFGRDPQNRVKMAVTPHGKEAITSFTIRKQYQWATLLDVQLLTGRTHQIRVHMAHIRHPILGDPLYGDKGRQPKGLNDDLRMLYTHFKRQALHAHTLTFNHPKTHEAMTLTAPIPNDLHRLLHAMDAQND
ncbi:MAG: 23S rRNA pseudouridine(1911/1915/1917) synthase RluD [Legionellaceae bacterium]